ncbi:GEVED domain-containing protein [Spirosoma sp. KNUC1025]|uniref:GEVED domain-containing protein n=1 Tax=Spirosoma sp. KNUC1025 TaxID=2894082 RepID=UPI00386F0F19|nr:T9SS type A sorting domain-containing protein [Spirosoma sp. KNUC1025]
MLENVFFRRHACGLLAAQLLACTWLLPSVHAQAQSLDFGDAPDSYGTLLSSNGARHTPFTRVYLGGGFGSYYDSESDGRPGSMANGDDTYDQDGNVTTYQNDEDGLVNGFPAVCLSKATYTLKISVYNNSGSDATVSAWIDFNRNGVFDPNERTQTVVPTTPNLAHYNGTVVSLTWSNLNGLTEGWTFARVRVANNSAEVASPTGFANTGEVEDYRMQLKDEYDFGDAPASYGTLLAANGARHLINNNQVLLGPLDCSADADGQPSVLADADAGETAVSFPYRLTTAKTAYSVRVNVLNTSGANAMLSGWIDFNRNGIFESSERAQSVIAADDRNLILSWSGLSGLTEGRTYARFRVATTAAEVANPTGLANDGSVDDYSLMIEAPQYDYGDAPASYGTSVSGNGARHVYNDVVTKLTLGNYMDAEANGQPSELADGDDASDFSGPMFDDEEGLVNPPDVATNSTSCTATLAVKNQTGADATLSGWIDFNRNGTFESSERAQVIVPSSQGSGLVQVKLNWTDLSGLTDGQTYMRFRIGTNAAEVAEPTGAASDGEVEDYNLVIASVLRSPLPVNLVSFEGKWIANKGNELSWITSWEKENDHFEIQRSSVAKSFETIGRVNGKGTTSAVQTYGFVDEIGAQSELMYYRLKQVDVDGRTSYSRIISVWHEVSTSLSVVVYPNPVVEQLTLKLSANQSIDQLRVYNAGGVQVMSQEGKSEWLDVRSLPAGVYIIDVTTVSGQAVRQRFVKR